MAKKLPVSGKKAVRSIKPQKARRIIRRFHVLLKNRDLALADSRVQEAHALNEEIASLGGLEMYQRASLNGQSRSRGGDSSRLLVKWLNATKKGRLLEVGCLDVENACTRSNLFADHKRIDLNSQDPRIEKQDFMKMRPERFDVISLSLVVNYVPSATERGEMLRRAHEFLSSSGLLFFVLPRACIDNSRYFNDIALESAFRSVGFAVTNYKKSEKLVYYLLARQAGTGEPVPKKLRRDGAKLNNFCIIL